MLPLIAVVDDHESTRRFIAAMFARAGYAVEEYVDGQDFLDRYTPRPGCVVLNYMMPRKDGDVTLGEMRYRRWTVPVLGTSSDPQYADRMLWAGAQAFFRVPCENENLLAGVRERFPVANQPVYR